MWDNKQVQQSFVRNNVLACFIKHVYNNIFILGECILFNKARWNIVANEGLLYSFISQHVDPLEFLMIAYI
jgi:hypothetical protein